MAVDAVAVADQIIGRRIEGKGITQLLTDPCGRGIGRDVEMKDASAIMCQDEEAVEQLERGRRHDEEVDGDEAACMILEERLPSLRRRLVWPRHVLGDGGFGNVMAQQMEFRLDARRAR